MFLADIVQLILVAISLVVAVALIVSVLISNHKAGQQLAMIAEITAQTHTLVNKRYGESLMAQVLLARSVARLTTDPAEKAAADRIVASTEQAYRDHQDKQAVLDASQPQISSEE